VRGCRRRAQPRQRDGASPMGSGLYESWRHMFEPRDREEQGEVLTDPL
jgi:hypothetical protein